jgi:hypothetical protein
MTPSSHTHTHIEPHLLVFTVLYSSLSSGSQQAKDITLIQWNEAEVMPWGFQGSEDSSSHLGLVEHSL